MVRRTKEEAAATREALIDAAEEMFMQHGVARTSLEQIARHAGMTRGALYWHFKNKTDLVKAMRDREHLPFQDLFDQVDIDNPEASPLETIRLACLQGLRQLESPRKIRVHTILTFRCEFFSDFNPQAMHREISDDIRSVLQRYFTLAEAKGQLQGITAPAAAELMHSVLSGLFHSWIRNPEDYSIAERGESVINSLMGLLSTPGALEH
ncbi:TetR family transcriptional regulator [Marinobacterium sp. AK62]|uniref:TetR family transcriptional regulator n=1 Tax=Marinobacterium alkalitolerans TaxID=1542925 RepID=A0ABS3ZAC6_9GAMM|nr:TetR family transcriptional regulator [Marinobacterium alkalitolerans]MBP0047999.1 TetR family transcriptional regulator [Marinobacterium alkalitolerans]